MLKMSKILHFTSSFLQKLFQPKHFIYRVDQKKDYHRVCSLNQPINWYNFFLYLYTDNSFLTNILKKLKEKRLNYLNFVKLVPLIAWPKWFYDTKSSQRINLQLFRKLFDQFMFSENFLYHIYFLYKTWISLKSFVQNKEKNSHCAMPLHFARKLCKI